MTCMVRCRWRRQISRSCSRGSGGVETPFDRVQRRRAGGIQSAEGWSGLHKGRNAICSMGAGRAKSPASGQSAIRLNGAPRLDAEKCHSRGARGWQSPCQRSRGTTAHIVAICAIYALCPPMGYSCQETTILRSPLTATYSIAALSVEDASTQMGGSRSGHGCNQSAASENSRSAELRVHEYVCNCWKWGYR